MCRKLIGKGSWIGRRFIQRSTRFIGMGVVRAAIVTHRDSSPEDAFADWIFWGERSHISLNPSHDVHLDRYDKDAGPEQAGF